LKGFVPQEHKDTAQQSPTFGGRDFADEATRLYNFEVLRPSLTLIQGLMILFAYEARFGQANTAEHYLNLFYDTHSRLSLNEAQIPTQDVFLDTNISRSWQAISKSLWGIYMVEW
jgi:hypothetical protein